MCGRILVLVFTVTTSLCARDKIAFVEFLGYRGIDVEAIRKALPFHEGDPVTRALRQQAKDAVKRVTGLEATDVAIVCCVQDGDSAVFIGLPGKSSRVFTLNAAPAGDAVPPAELTSLCNKMQKAEDEAFKKGSYEEDGSPGYRLSKEPDARAAELALREYAMKHEEEIVRVLDAAAKADRRAMAAVSLGYGANSARQMAALLRASRDPDSGVRNDAMRALGEILGGNPSLGKQLPADTFIDMIRSGVWTDRNKSSAVLWSLTESRDPELLKRLKAEASDALEEMARWQGNWAFLPRVILARIAGIPEDQANQLAIEPLATFLTAVGR